MTTKQEQRRMMRKLDKINKDSRCIEVMQEDPDKPLRWIVEDLKTEGIFTSIGKLSRLAKLEGIKRKGSATKYLKRMLEA